MATVTEKKAPEQVLPDINTRYAYVLAHKNERRGKVYDENGNPRPEREYKPYMNVLLKSSIIWPGGKDPFSGKERAAGKHGIRYYDGCTTLFIDDQPREKDTLDSLIQATREMWFSDGYCYVFGYDTMLKNYFDWCSYNLESPYRVPSVDAKFKPVDAEKSILAEGELLELEDKAAGLAKDASLNKMMVRAKYLGIAVEDSITSMPFSEKAIRIEYRKAAKANPKNFINSYNDKTLEIRNWISDAIDTGEIDIKAMQGKAIWKKANSVIGDIAGLKDRDLIIDKLVEITQVEDGADFLAQLKAIYN